MIQVDIVSGVISRVAACIKGGNISAINKSPKMSAFIKMVSFSVPCVRLLLVATDDMSLRNNQGS